MKRIDTKFLALILSVLCLEGCGAFFFPETCDPPYLRTERTTLEEIFTGEYPPPPRAFFDLSDPEGTIYVEPPPDLRLESLKGSITWGDDWLRFPEIQTGVGETTEYQFEDLELILADRILSVKDMLGNETLEVNSLSPRDRFLGWAPRRNDGFLIQSDDGSLMHYRLKETNSGGFWLWETRLKEGPVQWLSEKGYLVQLASGRRHGDFELLRFYNYKAEITSRLILRGDSCPSMQLYLQKGGEEILFGTAGWGSDGGYCSTWEIRMAESGNEALLIPDKEDGPVYLIDFVAETVTEVESPTFEQPEPTILYESQSGQYSVDVSNEKQVWDFNFKIEIYDQKDRYFSGKSADADLLKFNYEIEVSGDLGASKVIGKGKVGFMEELCYRED